MTTATEETTLDRINARVQALRNEYSNLALPEDQPTPRLQDEAAGRRSAMLHRLTAVTAASDVLKEVEPLIVLLSKQQTDLTEIRTELAAQYVAACRIGRHDAPNERIMRGLEISLRIIDGRFDLESEAVPASCPVFDALHARGYATPAGRWHPMAALFGSAPTIQKRVRELEDQRDAALAVIRALLV